MLLLQNVLQVPVLQKVFVVYQDFLNNEVRYTALVRQFPERAKELFAKSEADAKGRYDYLKALANLDK